MKKHIVRFVSPLVVCMLLLTFVITKEVNAKDTAASKPLDTRTLAMINKPGVVLVQTVWTADITFYEFSFVSGFEDDLTQAVSDLIDSGTIPNTEEAMYSAMVDLMIQYMGDYVFNTGNVYQDKTSTAAVGTGFIITPDGYLVTNAHVVATDEDELYRNFAMTALQNYAVEGTNSFVSEMRTYGYEMTKEQTDGLLNAFYNLMAANIEVDNLQTSYQCFLGNVTPGSDVSTKAAGLDLRKMGEPIPGKDVAILKIDKTNLPTVKLGDDSKLRTGDKVYAMGYPAVATLSDALNVAQAIQEPTLTSGIISARKEMAGGWNILQTDAAIHGGNSGGPLFNEDGEVIGINTFGMIDPNSGGQVAGMNFAVPISIAVQFLNEINVTPKESQFTTQFKKANSLFEKKKYDQALEILRGLNETNPGFPVVADLLAECRTLADQQPKTTPGGDKKSLIDKISGDSKGIIIIGAAAAGVVVILVIVIFVISSGRKKKQAYQPEASGPIPVDKQASQSTNTKSCPGCGKVLPADSKFCFNCGYAFPTQSSTPARCPNCNHPVQPGSMFCSECGTRFFDGQ